MRGRLARKIYKLQKEDTATIYSPSGRVEFAGRIHNNPEEGEFVVDSGASMHMVSKKDLNKAELETVRMSKNPTMLVTANGEVQIREEATVFVRELDLFVTVMLLESTPAVPSLGELCEEFWVQLPLDQWPETTSHQKWQENSLRHIKSCTIRRTWFINELLYLIYFCYIFIAGNCD